MAKAVYSFGVALALLATVGIIYTLASKEWKRNSQVASQSSAVGVRQYEGLWVRCTVPVPGQIRCDQYDESLIGLKANLQAQRALMCIAAVFSIFGVIAGIMGMDCISAMRGSSAKIWTSRSGGGLMLLAGLLTEVTVSWYAAEVTQQYQLNQIYQPNYQQVFVFEYGPALYVGWVTGFLAIASGFLLGCCGDRGEDVQVDYRYEYKPSSKPPNRAAEYV